MTILPIVERELRGAARRPGTYWLRLTAAFVAITVFGWMLLTLLRDNVPAAAHGRYLFRVLFGLAFAYCLFIGAWLTADCLSGEKREGTLGLLFLTDLKGYDVIFGKLAATSLSGFYGLLAIFPILAVPLLLGGLTNGEFWRAALVLVPRRADARDHDREVLRTAEIAGDLERIGVLIDHARCIDLIPRAADRKS